MHEGLVARLLTGLLWLCLWFTNLPALVDARSCPQGYFLCAAALVCIPLYKRCDGHIDCYNENSDEFGCRKYPGDSKSKVRLAFLLAGCLNVYLVDFGIVVSLYDFYYRTFYLLRFISHFGNLLIFNRSQYSYFTSLLG